MLGGPGVQRHEKSVWWHVIKDIFWWGWCGSHQGSCRNEDGTLGRYRVATGEMEVLLEDGRFDVEMTVIQVCIDIQKYNFGRGRPGKWIGQYNSQWGSQEPDEEVGAMRPEEADVIDKLQSEDMLIQCGIRPLAVPQILSIANKSNNAGWKIQFSYSPIFKSLSTAVCRYIS